MKVELDLRCYGETAKAVCLGDNAQDSEWIPKSLLDEWPSVNESGTVAIEEWKARELGWT